MPIYDDNTPHIKIQEGNYAPEPWDTVKIVQQGGKYFDVIAMERPVLGHIKRIDTDHYEVLATGEIKEYRHNSTSESRDFQNLRRTFARLRRLIRTNFVGDESEAFLTITYGGKYRDAARVQSVMWRDYAKFVMKLKYHYAEMKLEYIAVSEPQGDGTWHMHVTIKNTAGNFWINQSVLRKLWGKGNVSVERIKSGDLGSYYVAYFTDMLQPSEDKHAHEDTITAEQKSKARIKGERLKYYPKNAKFYRCSRGIRDPTEYYCVLGEGIADEFEKVWERSVNVEKVTDDGVQVVNRIYKATYKERESDGK